MQIHPRVMIGCDVRRCPVCRQPLSWDGSHYICRTCMRPNYELSGRKAKNRRKIDAWYNAHRRLAHQGTGH